MLVIVALLLSAFQVILISLINVGYVIFSLMLSILTGYIMHFNLLGAARIIFASTKPTTCMDIQPGGP